MKFIHTSDWHIGRQLHNQSLLEDQRYVLEQIVALAIREDVDAVIIAGDIYDRSVPPANAVALLDEVLNRLVNELQISVFMIAGNHDGHERLGFAARQMASSGLHIVGPLSAALEPVVIKAKKPLAGRAVCAAFYGLPYADPVTVRHVFADMLGETASETIQTHEQAMTLLLAQVRAQAAAVSVEKCENSVPQVVVSHCFLDGGEASDSERPLSIGGADRISPALFSDFNYVALGHLHGPQQKGADHVRYSGSILKYSFSEQHHKKSVTLVTLDEQGQASIELHPLTPLRNLRVIEGMLGDLLKQGAADAERDDYVMIRLLDSQAILDAMGKLRTVYPNVMHLERTGLMAQDQDLELSREHIKKGERVMFEDFFEQVSGESLSEEQKQVLDETINTIHKAERNA